VVVVVEVVGILIVVVLVEIVAVPAQMTNEHKAPGPAQA
jgi:hypothetical protein